MQLALFHGRRDATADMDGETGFDGPRLEGVTAVHFVYMGIIRVHFETAAHARSARSATGWERWDENTLQIELHDDLVSTVDRKGRAYYGDWSLLGDVEA